METNVNAIHIGNIASQLRNKMIRFTKPGLSKRAAPKVTRYGPFTDNLQCRMNQIYGGNRDNRIHQPGEAREKVNLTILVSQILSIQSKIF